MKKVHSIMIALIGAAASLSAGVFAQNQNFGFAPTTARDPGARAGSVGAGSPLPNMSAEEVQYFNDGLVRFMEVDSVSGTLAGESGHGLGPGFNSNSCASCHAQPAAGGSSPNANAFPNIGPNPQIAIASDAGASKAFLRSLPQTALCAKRASHS